jgi:hypothetical protein
LRRLFHTVTSVEPPRRRIGIPTEIWGQLRWTNATGPTPSVAILEKPGLMVLVEGAVWTKELLPRRRQLEEMLVTDHSAEEELFLLLDRYKQVIIAETEHRFTLSNEMLVHLGLSDLPKPIYLEANCDMVRIMSVSYRNARLSGARLTELGTTDSD